MPIGKRTNKNREKGDRGEDLTREKFGLAPTSGSGCGSFDKLDCKNDWLRVEVKVTEKDHYTVNFSKFELWRLHAANDRKQMFLHIIPERGKKLVWEESLVACSRSLLVALSDSRDRSRWDQTHRYCEENAKVELIGWAPEYSALFIDDPRELIREFHSELVDSSFVVVRAPYFKQLLDKDNEDED